MRQPARSNFRAKKVGPPAMFPAPTAGWISNQNIALPDGQVLGARVLDNWWPNANDVTIRRGTQRYATFGDETLPVTSIFDYANGVNERLFAANQNSIWDITSVVGPQNYTLGDGLGNELGDGLGNVFGLTSIEAEDLVYSGLTGGHWITTQFATTGGIFTVGVNGFDDMILFDGSRWYQIGDQDIVRVHIGAVTGGPFVVGETLTGAGGATGVILYVDDEIITVRKTNAVEYVDFELVTGGTSGATANTTAGANEPWFLAITGVETSSLDFVWSYKSRLFFIQKGSFNVYYLDIDAVGGRAELFPMGGLFPNGGYLMIGLAWSMDSSGDGGLSEQCVFVSSEGECVVYQGANPSLADQWSKVGLYRIGRPRGPRAWVRSGADIQIATDIGDIPLTQALQRDAAHLSPAATSFPIEPDWNTAVNERSPQNWQCIIWDGNQMKLVAMPLAGGTGEHQTFVANINTGAWARFTGWDIHSICEFRGRLYAGSSNGRVMQLYISGNDETMPYTAVVAPLFTDLQTPLQLKMPRTGRVVMKSAYDDVEAQISVMEDYTVDLPPPPDAVPLVGADVWGTAIWGQSQWGVSGDQKIIQWWEPLAGRGYALSPAVQITSGSIVPLDIKLVRIEMTYENSDIVS